MIPTRDSQHVFNAAIGNFSIDYPVSITYTNQARLSFLNNLMMRKGEKTHARKERTQTGTAPAWRR